MSYRQQQIADLGGMIADARSAQAYDASNGGSSSSYFSDRIQGLQLQQQRFDLEERKDYAASRGDAQMEQYLYGKLQETKAQLQTRMAAGNASAWEYTKAYASGAGEGAQGGGSIVANTFTFGGSDYVGLTNSTSYQGSAYTGSRVAATVSREAFTTAATLGTAQVARGGIAGTSWSADLVNAAASSPRLYNASRVTATAMATYDIASGGYHIGHGYREVSNGNNWGYLEMAGGGLSLVGGTASAWELNQRQLGGAYQTIKALTGEVNHMPAKAAIRPVPKEIGPSIWMEAPDHAVTASYALMPGSRKYIAAQTKLVASGKFEEAMQMDIDNVRSLFPGKYEQGISEMVNYVNRINRGGKR